MPRKATMPFAQSSKSALTDSSSPLPEHATISLSTRAISALGILLALALLVWNLLRLTRSGVLWSWWTPFAGALGFLAADFTSGLIHWAADTWGRESMPIIGRRLLHPFRVHHVNPDDFLRRNFIDTNGDVALLGIPLLTLALPLSDAGQGWGIAAVFVTAFCGMGLFTNQFHQWAHRPEPPFLVRRLQDCGLILGREAHGRHHAYPFVESYCITTGWCNRWLGAVDFFRRLERVVHSVTGWVPRKDETHFHFKLSNRPRAEGRDAGGDNA